MAMTLADILEQQRMLYLDEFARRLGGYSADLSGVLQSEALFCLADGSAVRTGSLGLSARGDICVRREGRVSEIARIEAPHTLGFQPFRFVWSEALQVALHPFAWNECQLCIPEPLMAIDNQPLIDWFEAALIPGQPSAQPGRRLGALHSMSEPREAVDGVRFEVDFGSAPVAAFESLLSALVCAGAGMLVVGRGSLST